MKILELSKQDVFSQICDNCKSVFAYSAEDGMSNFKCPVCKQKLVPTWEVMSNENEESGDVGVYYNLSDKCNSPHITISLNKLFNNISLDHIHNLNIGDIVVFPHSTYGDIMFDVCAKDYMIDGTATLVSRKCITKMKWNKNDVNNYSKSSIRHWLNHDFLSGFDDSIINVIKSPYWKCHDGKYAIILSDKISIPSMTEMGINHSCSQEEGTAFAYTNIADKFDDMIDGKSPSYYCWTRTPDSSYADHVCGFFSSGKGDRGKCTVSYGVPVCFII